MDNLKKIENLFALKEKPKFNKSEIYFGLKDNSNKETLEALLNSIIDLFVEKCNNKTNNEEYQTLILDSLNKFNDYHLDTEDREYICSYFEKIMDAIYLESSGGVINEWLYGFKF